MKKVSIIIPAYNKADMTAKVVESVLNQTYRNIEVIVVDDGSTDNTRQRLIPYTDKIKYVYKENGGACSARNVGIRFSTGEYIGFLDCDDLYLPEKIGLSVDFLERHPDFGLVYNAAYFIDEKENILRIFSHYKSRHTGWIANGLLLRNFICNSTVIIRRSCFEKVGIFDETIFIPADWDMWLRLAEQYKVGYINLPLTYFRISDSYIIRHIEQTKREEFAFLGKAFQRNLGLKSHFKDKVVSNVHCRCALYYLFIADFGNAKKELFLSIRKHKLNIKAILLLISYIVARKTLPSLIKKKVFYNFGL